MSNEQAQTNATDVSASAAAGPIKGDAAYQLLLPQYQAIPLESLGSITVDVASVVTLVIGSLPEIRKLAGEIQKKEPELTLDKVEQLRVAALALNYAHAAYLSAAPADDNLDKLGAEAIERFGTLSADGTTLARRGLINGKELEDMGSPVGYKNVAVALTRFVSVFRRNWETIKGKCAVTQEELETTLQLAELILTAVGLKEKGAAKLESATEYRLRAFFFLANEYDRFRQVITFIRWKQGDADKIAPSIYSARNARRREATEPPPAPAVEPAPSVGANPAETANSAVGANPPAAAARASAEDPRAEPFMR